MNTLTRALLLTLCLPAVAFAASTQKAPTKTAPPHHQDAPKSAAPKPEAPKAEVKAETVSCTITGEEVAKGEALTSVYEGKTYYFCCGGCKKTFDKNPAKYAKAFEDKKKDAKQGDKK